MTVPVSVAGTETRFLLDTGAGLNLISGELAERAGCRADGPPFTGRRMSGQELTIPVGVLSSLGLGGHASRDVPVGLFDVRAFGLAGIDGILSLSYFREQPVTIDYPAGLVILEDAASMAGRERSGTPVPVQVKYDRCSADVLLGISLPGGRPIMAEVDTGSEDIILDESLAADAGVDLAGPGTRTHEGTDQTGHTFVRYFSAVRGDVCVTGAPQFRVTGPDVMLQKIIYDGLVGSKFLRSFVTTYDLPNSRMIFGQPAA